MKRGQSQQRLSCVIHMLIWLTCLTSSLNLVELVSNGWFLQGKIYTLVLTAGHLILTIFQVLERLENGIQVCKIPLFPLA